MILPKVKILIEGYVSAESGGHSCSTISLIQAGDMNIIVDPGTLPNQKVLLNALKKEHLTPEDIDIVYITHSHLDHYRNIGMFESAKSLDFYGWWIGDEFQDYSDPGANIKMIKTPGHSYDGTTLLVKTERGVVAICGDIFWKKDFPINDPYATDKKKLTLSRERVLESADFVIPGHGGMFEVKK